MRTLTEPNGWIGSVAFSRDGRTLAAKETYKSTPLNDRCCIKTINLWYPRAVSCCARCQAIAME